MQGVDADIQKVAVLIYETYGLLLLAVVIYDFQAVEATDAVVDMRDVVARFQVV